MSYGGYNIKRLMSTYGNDVRVITNNTIYDIEVFIEPFKERHRIYISDDDKTLMKALNKASVNGYLLYIGPTDVPINETTVVSYKNSTYRIVSSEEARISKKFNYTWAILEPIQKGN